MAVFRIDKTRDYTVMSVQFHALANIIHYAAFMKAVEKIMKKWQD